jgi:hypothetical protein
VDHEKARTAIQSEIARITAKGLASESKIENALSIPEYAMKGGGYLVHVPTLPIDPSYVDPLLAASRKKAKSRRSKN